MIHATFPSDILLGRVRAERERGAGGRGGGRVAGAQRVQERAARGERGTEVERRPHLRRLQHARQGHGQGADQGNNVY